MKFFNRIIAGFSAVAILFANICVASADVSSDPGVRSDWWTNLMHNVAQRWDGLSICDIPCGTLVVNVASLACGQVCELSGDHWHHADESDYLKVSEGRDGTYAVRAKCKYCHKEFIATGLTADNLSTAYSDYVNTLPAQGYDSAGTLLWQPRWIEDTVTSSAYLTVTRAYSGDKDRLSLFKFNDNTVVSEIDLDDPVYSYSISGSKVIVQVGTRSEFYLAFRNSSSHYFCAPITGKYTCLSSSYSYFSKYVSASETICQGRSQWEYANYSKYVDAGSAVGISSYSTSVGSSWGIRGTFELYTSMPVGLQVCVVYSFSAVIIVALILMIARWK